MDGNGYGGEISGRLTDYPHEAFAGEVVKPRKQERWEEFYEADGGWSWRARQTVIDSFEEGSDGS